MYVQVGTNKDMEEMVQCILTLNEVYTLFLVNFICVIFVHVILLHFRRVKRARMKPMRYPVYNF